MTEAAGPGACEVASERVGELVCIESIRVEDEWSSVATEAEAVDQDQSVKYLVPVDDTQPLPTAFVNSQRYALHYDFLRDAFPEHYGLLQWDEYVAMIVDPGERAYFGGNVSRYVEADGSNFYGFIVWDDPQDASTTPTYDNVLSTWRALQEQFGLAELVYVPWSNNQRDAAENWTDAPFAIRGDDGVTYEVYNPAVGYGTVRFVGLDELEAASLAGEFGYQDILVLDEAPMDLSRVVSGMVTGTRQAALSHLNVRMVAHGTPNCYVAEPETRLAAWEGRLVRLECGQDGYSVAQAEQSQAEAHWDAMRPEAVEIREADVAWNAPLPLLDVPTASVDERETAFTRFGAKGANLAALYQRIDSGYQLDGFVIPFSFYDRFVRGNAWVAPVQGGVESLTFADTLSRWHSDADFLSDTALRNERLGALRDAMAVAVVDQADLDTIATEILHIYGRDTTMVRFRSSSNAEDGVSFSGAGLYESASACLADDVDAGDEGPSVCDEDKDSEHGLADALRLVWASLWGAGAWEERDWYGIDQDLVAMAVLVNTQSEFEQANIVAFTGNPLGEQAGWLVESQVGDLDVVSAESGVTPERVLLTVAGGGVEDIERIAESSEVFAGDEVLSDTQLNAVGALLWNVDAVMPRDGEGAEDYRWDTEQKVLSDGRLVIKQVRPW